MATGKSKIPHVACLISVGQYCFRLMHDAVNIDLYVWHDPVFYFKF